MNSPMHCSWEGPYDPNCIAFFSPKAFRFSCSNFAVCGENNGVFTNTLHPVVKNSVGKKRHSLIYSWIGEEECDEHMQGQSSELAS